MIAGSEEVQAEQTVTEYLDFRTYTHSLAGKFKGPTMPSSLQPSVHAPCRTITSRTTLDILPLLSITLRRVQYCLYTFLYTPHVLYQYGVPSVLFFF